MPDLEMQTPEDIQKLLRPLIQAGCERGLLEQQDIRYACNRLLAVLKLEDVPVFANNMGEYLIPGAIHTALDRVVQWAVASGKIANLPDACDQLASELMNCLMPRPSEVNRQFWERYKRSAVHATDWFYDFCTASQYIQLKQVEKNINYQAESQFGRLDITINLSKPEKNPAAIAAARLTSDSGYPRCLLCAENEGYRGRTGYPARSNHRLIALPQKRKESWYLQYSPYSYYPEHCIVLSDQHRPMQINRQTFNNLLDFLDLFPHYFIGSNADLPIVGGSILSHDHYQGGRHIFAMERAPIEFEFSLNSFSAIKAGIVRWPMSVLRLKSADAGQLAECSDQILGHWRSYHDADADIYASTGKTPHNTITPIARYRNGLYEMDLVLRNNRQTKAYPYGQFHPHPDVHHIKQENIGLIEVMGLAVLPARLVPELEQVALSLTGHDSTVPAKHIPWAQELKQRYGLISNLDQARLFVQTAVAEKFERVLADAGVFKRDTKGRAAFRRYLIDLEASIRKTSCKQQG